MSTFHLKPTLGNAFAGQRAELLRNSKLTQDQANKLLIRATLDRNPVALYGALEAGADPNIPIQESSTDLRRTLLSHIIDFPLRRESGEQPEYLEAFRMALTCGADPYTPSYYWEGYEPTALGYAIENFANRGENDIHLKYVSILLDEFKVNPDFAGVDNGNILPTTSLIHRCHCQDHDFIKHRDFSRMLLLVLENGAHIEADYNGKTFLFECTEKGNPDDAQHAAKLLNIAFRYRPDPFRVIQYKESTQYAASAAEYRKILGNVKSATARERAIEYGNPVAANLLCRYELAYRAWCQQGSKPAGPVQVALLGHNQEVKTDSPDGVIDADFVVKTNPTEDYFTKVVEIIDRVVNETSSGKTYSEEELRELIEPVLINARRHGSLPKIFSELIQDKPFMPYKDFPMNIFGYLAYSLARQKDQPIRDLGINLRKIFREWGATTILEDLRLKDLAELFDKFYTDGIHINRFVSRATNTTGQQGDSYAIVVFAALSAIFNKLAGNISDRKTALSKSVIAIREILLEAAVDKKQKQALEDIDVGELIKHFEKHGASIGTRDELEDRKSNTPLREGLLADLFAYRTDMPLFEKKGGVEVDIFEYLQMMKSHSNDLVSTFATAIHTVIKEYKP